MASLALAFSFCPRCGGRNAQGLPACATCQADLNPMVVVRQGAGEGFCASCQVPVPAGVYCVRCGSEIGGPAQTSVAARAISDMDLGMLDATAEIGAFRVTLPDGNAGPTEALRMEGTTVMGRGDGDYALPSDPHISPRHLAIEGGYGRLLARDLGTLNGTYLRLREPTVVPENGMILAGRQVLRVIRLKPAPPHVDAAGTIFMGSDSRVAAWALVRLTRSGTARDVYGVAMPGLRLGRTDGDVVMPEDAHLSTAHCRFEPREGGVHVADAGSSNGTWVRLSAPHPLRDGDELHVGQVRLAFLLPTMT